MVRRAFTDYYARAGLAVAILCLLTSGCSEPPKASAKRDLVIWGVLLGPDSKGQEAVIHEFERRHPEVHVRLLSMGAGRMDPQKLMTSIVGNVAPDVINQDRFTISDWASRKAFLPLDDLIRQDIELGTRPPVREDYYSGAWEEAMYEGSVYAIPSAADNRILYWNKGRFRDRASELRAAGLDPNRAPRTWSEVLAYSKVLTEFGPSGEIVKAGFLPNYQDAWLYLYAFQTNSQFISPDGRRSTMATPEAAEALAFMVEGYDQVGGYAKARAFESGFRTQSFNPFIIGTLAMKIDGDWNLNALSRYGPHVDIGVAPPPVPDDRLARKGRYEGEKDAFVTWSGGFSLAIPRGARNVADAWEYIKFASSKEAILLEAEAQRKWERHRGRTYIPHQVANREANEELFRRYRPADKKFAEALRVHIDMAAASRTRPATFVGQLLWSEHVRAMDSAISHKASPMEALRAAERTVQRDLDAHFERERYQNVSLAVPAWIGAGLATFLLLGVITWYRRQRLSPIARSETKWAFLFMSPWLVGFFVLTLGPMVASLFFSFTQYDVLNEARWVGGKNYADLVGSDWLYVKKSLTNVAYLGAIGVPLGIATGLAVAMLLNNATRGMRFFRTIFYMPAIVPAVASASLWIWVLTSDPSKGLINSGWVKSLTPWLGIAPPAWLASPDWSKNALILMGLWGAGSGMVLWLAGLKGISTSLYEAASIDGASPTKLFTNVTLPQLSPIIFFNVVMGFIFAVQEFDRMYLLSPSSVGTIGPDDSLLTPVFILFKNGFAFFKMGYASAIAWGIFAIVLILTLIQFRLAPKWVHYEADR